MSETLVRMPKLADTLVEGTLGGWLKQVGEAVAAGEPLASIETDKITTEMTSPATGTLLELLVAEGETVAVETVIARIGVAGQAEAALAPKPAPRPTPVAARLLAEHGLTPQQVTARPGRLTKSQVISYLEAHAPLPLGEGRGEGCVSLEPSPGRKSPLPGLRPVKSTPRGRAESTLVPLTRMRAAVADHMLKARLTIPHGQTVIDADLTGLVAWRELNKANFQLAENANLSLTVVFVHALARQLGADFGATVDLGVAVALDAGLIVPVLRNADSLTLGATARGIADLASRARARALTADDLSGARMTLTNVGSFGNLWASPIVPLGQLGILGSGLVERRPMPGPDGGVRPGWRCRLSLMFDRRALDDLAADRLLRGIAKQLERVAQAALA